MITKDIKPIVTINIPAYCNILSDYRSSILTFLEPVPLTNFTKIILYLTKLNYLYYIPLGIQGNNLLSKLI